LSLFFLPASAELRRLESDEERAFVRLTGSGEAGLKLRHPGVLSLKPVPMGRKKPQATLAHFRFVWRALHLFGVPDADLMGVAQNVFIVVHRQPPAFEGRA
jgi:hypothetical protein